MSKPYIVLLRCKKCDEFVELECDEEQKEMLLGGPTLLRIDNHNCPQRVDNSELIIGDFVSIRDNPANKPKEKISMTDFIRKDKEDEGV